MKSLLGITVFVLLGLLTAAIIAFPNSFSHNKLPYDYEQQGLKQQIVIKFAYVVAEDTPKGLAAEKFAQLVQQKTHGKVHVELFPDGSLYNEFDEIGALEQGNIQMTAPSFSIVSQQIPQWSIADLPFAFPNQDAVNAALNGDIGKQLLQTLPAHGIIGLALWENGFRQITNDKRPLVYPGDLAGLKIRTETSAVSESEFQTLGATTTALPFNQLYKRLEDHDVDGEENSISNIYTQKLYQVQTYMTVNRISYLGYAVLMNKKFWDGLPRPIQQEIQSAMQATTTWEHEQAVSINALQLEEMEDQSNIQVTTLSPSQQQAWVNALRPVYNQYAQMFGPRLMNDVRRLQEQYGPMKSTRGSMAK